MCNNPIEKMQNIIDEYTHTRINEDVYNGYRKEDSIS